MSESELCLPLRPGTIVSSSVFSSRRPSLSPQAPILASPGIILKLQPAPASHVYKGLFEISAETLGEMAARAEVLRDAAETRLERLLSLPFENSAALQRSLYTGNETMWSYCEEWKTGGVGTNRWKLVRNWCYFALVPKLLELHKVREQQKAAYNDYTKCVREVGQRERQRGMLGDTERRIEENKQALKELAKGKRPFVAGGVIHHVLSTRSKGKNPTQHRTSNVQNPNSELSLRLKRELSTRTLLLAVFRSWEVLSDMSRSIEAAVVRVEQRENRVMGQYCVAVWGRYTELRKEERTALKTVRGELAVLKRQRVLEGWRDALSLRARREILLAKARAVIEHRLETRVALCWREYTLGRKRKRLGWALGVELSSRVAGLKAAQSWVAAIILTQTLKLRVKALAGGETDVPSAEEIEQAAELEIIKGLKWQIQAVAIKRVEWKECKKLHQSIALRLVPLFTGLTPTLRLRLLAQWTHLGEHRSLKDLGSKTVNLVLSNPEALDAFPAFAVLKFTPNAVVPALPSPVSDPNLRAVHLKYAAHQRKFQPKAVPPVGKPPLKPPLSPETRIRSAPIAKQTVPKEQTRTVTRPHREDNLLTRVETDCQRLISALGNLRKLPESFLLHTAKSALKTQRLPLKQLLIQRYRFVQKAKVLHEWKIEALRRKLGVVLTIRYAIRVGKRFIHVLRDEAKGTYNPVVRLRSLLWGWRRHTVASQQICNLYYTKRSMRGWKAFIQQKASKLALVLQGQQHYQTALQKKVISAFLYIFSRAQRARAFRASLYQKTYFEAWKALKRGSIRSLGPA